MLFNDNITIKQLSYLLLDKGFKRCQIWKESDYLKTHSNTKKWRSYLISTKKMDILKNMGASDRLAQVLVLLEGNQKVNKRNLSLLGSPMYVGKIDELTIKTDLYNEMVCDLYITGLFRDKIDIIVK